MVVASLWFWVLYVLYLLGFMVYVMLLCVRNWYKCLLWSSFLLPSSRTCFFGYRIPFEGYSVFGVVLPRKFWKKFLKFSFHMFRIESEFQGNLSSFAIWTTISNLAVSRVFGTHFRTFLPFWVWAGCSVIYSVKNLWVQEYYGWVKSRVWIRSIGFRKVGFSGRKSTSRRLGPNPCKHF